MAQHKVELEKGITIGDTAHKVAYLRELNAGDVIAAMEESERVIMAPNGSGSVEPVLLLSNSLMGVNTLRRQIASIGDIKGPIERDQLNLLSDTDLMLLQQGVQSMDHAAAQAITSRGRTEATSTSD